MVDQKQAVAEPDNQGAKPAEQTTGAQDEDVDALLARYASQSAKTDSPTEPASTEPAEPDANEDVKARLAKLESEQVDRDVMAAATKAAEGTALSPREVERFLDSDAREDPRILSLFRDRRSNPQAWNEFIDAYGKRLAKRFPATDPAVTDDVNAVASAVQGASNKTPASGPAPAYGNMTNSEFRDAVMKEHGYVPPV